MADPKNRFSAVGPGSGVPGDLPDPLADRYFTEPARGGTLRLYRHATGQVPALEDAGRRLTARRNDPHLVADLVAIARHRGWTDLRVTGAPAFRREVWLQASLAGLEVRGHRPTARDRQDLDRRARRAERDGDRSAARRPPRAAGLTPEAARRLEIIRLVLQARALDPQVRARLTAYARRRLREPQRTAADRER